MRVLVCGGRDYRDGVYLYRVLYRIHDATPITCIIHGDARGADHLAKTWAEQVGIPILCFPANWKLHGKAAGHIRNREMIVEGKPDLVVAFPGGAGTANMVAQATKDGVPVKTPL